MNRPNETPPGARRLLRADGSLVIPPQLAAEVARRLVAELRTEAHANGGQLTPGARWLVWQLHECARAGNTLTSHVSSGDGTAAQPHGTVGVSARQAAEQLGCSEEYVRRLARTGRLTGRRIGRVWLVDPDAVNRFRADEP